MKTLQELYTEIISSEELKKAFADAADENKMVEFAKGHGVETTIEDIMAFLESKKQSDTELSPEDLQDAAGGSGCIFPDIDPPSSMVASTEICYIKNGMINPVSTN